MIFCQNSWPAATWPIYFTVCESLADAQQTLGTQTPTTEQASLQARYPRQRVMKESTAVVINCTQVPLQWQ